MGSENQADNAISVIYNIAKELMGNSLYDSASNIFIRLDTYKDSKQMAIATQCGSNDCKGTIPECFKYLKEWKQYVTNNDRKKIISYVINTSLNYFVHASSCDEFFMKCLDENEFKTACDYIKNANIPLSDIMTKWLIENLVNNSPKVNFSKILIENNEKNNEHIINIFQKELNDIMNNNQRSFLKIYSIMENFPWLFNSMDHELIKGWDNILSFGQNAETPSIIALKQRVIENFANLKYRGIQEKAKTFFIKNASIKMMYCPAGSFLMGSPCDG